MANTIHNVVKINCNLDKLLNEGWLIKTDGYYLFNLHKLFPSKFPEKFAIVDGKEYKNTFDKYYDHDWLVENLGVKLIPYIEDYMVSEENGVTYLQFDTPWDPPLDLIKQLHKQSGYEMEVVYDDISANFEGVYKCSNGECVDNRQPYSDA